MTLLTILAHAESDLRIPARVAVLARCQELRADSIQLSDTATAQQLKLLIDALNGGIAMVWSMGDLLVSSASAAGRVYTVSCGACNCPARKPCKHLKLVEVLLDMLDTAAGDADLEADCDEIAPSAWSIGALFGAGDPPNAPGPLGTGEGDELPARHFGTRLATVRSAYAYV